MKVLLLIAVIPICLFAQTNDKAVYGIIIDDTASLRSQLSNIVSIAEEAIVQIPEGSYISVFSVANYKSKRKTESDDCEMSPNKALCIQRIEEIYVQGGQTQLLDAILFAANRITTKSALQQFAIQSKVLIVITDGEDRLSKTSLDDPLSFLKDNRIKVYAIGLVKEVKACRKAMSFLENITSKTGGRAVFPDIRTENCRCCKRLTSRKKLKSYVRYCRIRWK